MRNSALKGLINCPRTRKSPLHKGKGFDFSGESGTWGKKIADAVTPKSLVGMIPGGGKIGFAAKKLIGRLF